MNILEKIFKRKVNYQRENYAVTRATLAIRQNEVYKAVALMAVPCTGRQIARFMGRDSASITPRLSELVRKGRLTVAYTKKSLDDRKWRKYYIVSRDKKF